jgi:hypothetical protein
VAVAVVVAIGIAVAVVVVVAVAVAVVSAGMSLSPTTMMILARRSNDHVRLNLFVPIVMNDPCVQRM